MDILPVLIQRLGIVLKRISNDFEVILVNDGSWDESWKVIQTLAKNQCWVMGINLTRNYGQHNALLCGIVHAQYEVIVTLDDDLQNPPEEIPNLLDELMKGYDVVYGTPIEEKHSLWRKLASAIAKITLQSAMSAKEARNVSAFRMFRSVLKNAFSDYSIPYVSIDVLLSWTTTHYSSIPVRHDPRFEGESNYNLTKLLSHAMNLMTGYSVAPLKLASVVGLLFTILGIVILAYIVGRYLIQGGSVPGFSFIASIIAIFSGAQLFAIGIIGEYLARIHYRMMDRPSYLVRDKTKEEFRQ